MSCEFGYNKSKCNYKQCGDCNCYRMYGSEYGLGLIVWQILKLSYDKAVRLEYCRIICSRSQF